jgi:hypothetical protein
MVDVWLFAAQIMSFVSQMIKLTADTWLFAPQMVSFAADV